MKTATSIAPTNKRKQSSKCEVCDVMFSNDQELNSHLISREHKMAHAEAIELQRPLRLADPSTVIVVSQLSTKISLHELENVVTPCGEIKQIVLSKSSSNSEPVCLIEFASATSVVTALKKPPILNGKPLSVSKYHSRSTSACRDPSLEREISRKKVCFQLDTLCPEAECSKPSSSSKNCSTTVQLNGTRTKNVNINHNSKSLVSSPGEKLLKSLEASFDQLESSKSSYSESICDQGNETKSSSSQVFESTLSKGSGSVGPAKVPGKASIKPQEKAAAKVQEKVVCQIAASAKVSTISLSKNTNKSFDKTISKVPVSKESSKESTCSSAQEISQIVPSSSQTEKVKVDDKLYDEKIIRFVNELQVNLPKLENMFMECFYGIERAISLLNVEFNCYMFGSSYTGLCWEGSDLDVYIQWGQVVTNTDIVLNECRKVLFRSGQFERVIIIKARTPLIKCRHKKTGIESDISFKSRLGVYNSVLIKMLLVFDERVKPMIVFLKFWAQKNDLLGSNKVNSYCLAWMVIYFLQTQNILPAIEYLNNFGNNKTMYLGWNVSFFNLSVSAIERLKELFLEQNPYKEKSIRQLLLEFFDFYLTFDYGKNVLCPFIGSSIRRSDIEQLKNIPPSMDWFVRAQQSCAAEDNMFDRAKTFCLQDPIELTFNIGKCVSPKLKDHFKLCCKTATNILVAEKSDSVVAKLLQERVINNANGESSRPNVSEQEEVSMSIDQLFHSLKKSQCYSMLMGPGEEKKLYGPLFNRKKWIAELFFAFLYLLKYVFQFEISVTDKKSCSDPVLNMKYESLCQTDNKLDLDKCQIVYCKGYSVLFYNRKKYKSLVIPKSHASKPEIEKEIYRNSQILQKELDLRNNEQRRQEKFCFVFCFNPVQNQDKVALTFMRYFNTKSIPAAVNYQMFFNYAQANFLSLMSKAVRYVHQNKSKINLGSQLNSTVKKYEDLLTTTTESTPAKSSPDNPKRSEELTEKKTPDETSIISANPVLNVKGETVTPPPEKDVNDSGRHDDSDIEEVPVEPKVFECIDVE